MLDSLTDGLRETLACFDPSGAPRTTSEVAAQLELGRRSTYDRLDRLVDRGRLETKKVGASARVWWRPGPEPTSDERAHATDLEEFESLVAAVEEYAIFRLDAEGRVRSWNAGAERIKGYEVGAILGEHVSTFYTDEDTEEGVPGENLATAAAEGSVEDEGWRVREDGSTFWANVTITAIRDDDGDLDGFVKVTRDMTDRREYERQLERQRDDVETELQEVFERVDDAFYALDDEWRFTHANERAEELLDSSIGELLGRSVWAEFPEVADSRMQEEYERALDTQEPVSFEEYYGPLDAWFELRAYPSETGLSVYFRDVTERKERERELERYETIVETVEDGVYVLDDEFRFERVNDAYVEMTGYDREELLGSHASLVVDDAVVDESAEQLEAALVGATDGGVLEADVQRADGTTLRAESRFTGIPGDGEGFPKKVGVVRDISDRVERERELERYETIVETVEEGIYVVDDGGYFTEVNESYAEMVDRPREEVLGSHVTEVVDDEVVETAQGLERELAAGERSSASLEAELDRGDGETVIGRATFELLPGEDGLQRVGVVRDVTERRRAQRQLREERDMFAQGPAVVFRWEPDAEAGWPVEYVSENVEAVLGYEPEELESGDVPYVDLLLEEELDRIGAEVERATESGADRFTHEPYRIETRDGDVRWVKDVTTIVRDDDGAVVNYLGYLVDVTERKERERELEESQRRYRTVVENFPNGAVALVDDDLRYRTAGGRPVDVEADTGDDMAGLRVREAISDDLADVLEPRYRAALDGEESTFEHEHAGGTSRFQIVPVGDAEGEVFGAMGMSQDVTDRVEYEERLLRQHEQLEALDELNRVVREITDAVVDQSTREEIEATVCEHIAASDSYAFAWIGDVDARSQTVDLRTEAGVSGYLDGVTISVDPDDERSEGPTGRAFRTGEMQVTSDLETDPSHDPWRDRIEEYGFRSSAAIPIVHEDAVYGVLNVYAERPHAFEGEERSVIGQVGEVVGHAIAAAERKRALTSDELVELEFRIWDVLDELGIDASVPGTVALDHAVPVADGEYLLYGTATPDSIDAVRAIAEGVSHWESVSVRSDEDDAEVHFEVRLSQPPVLTAVASAGGAVDEAVIEDDDYRMTIHVSPDVEVRRVIDVVEDAYPAAQLLKRHQIQRPEDDAERAHRTLTGDLTDRQRTALEAAYHAGFFEWPRGATGEEVAESLGVASATFHQHLRKAERKVFDEVVPGGLGGAT